ncbi:hypothetical protein GCM10010124_23920 [Pilimelia terevasa]|uniref:Pyridoxamine 5'-phosphate oxidase putative domain-containing protein n=1 Tax=Pilimelia terevasa TaxID=53372 RepID=A0A8J3BPZ4_9ACTN|nr:hypothetical protein [Pilimelia terevasa]GGK30365.1 hypothetical protein GCM10010124_23920 [Pilimelia terevasa]
MTEPAPPHPLVAEASRRAALVWVAAAGRPAAALWCLPLADGLYVVTGPGEQDAPGLAGAATAEVTARGDHGGRIATWTAAVDRIAPDGPRWAEAAAALAAKRLNGGGPAADLVARWAADGVAVLCLAPTPAPPAGGADLPAGAQAAPPRDTPATRPARRPFRLHRVRRPPRG